MDWMTFAISMGLTMGGVALHILVGLLTPGRKGKIRTEKTVFHPGVAPADAWETYARRLRFEGFQFEKGTADDVLYAGRRKAADALSPFEIKSFGKMPLKAEVHFDLRPDGVAVRLVLWTTSNVFVDTGESRFIDAMIDRLFNADLERQPPPVVQNISGNASSSLYISFVLIAAPFLFFLPWFDMERTKSFMGGIFLAFITNLVMAGLGLRDTIMRPLEMSGKWRAVVGILLSFVAVGVTLVVFAIARFGEIASGQY